MPASSVAHDPSPTLAANQRRNDEGLWWRAPRWHHSRARLWKLLARHVKAGARVAVVGAGNGHDLPLARLARRAGELWLFDLDSTALHRARQRSRHADRVVVRQLDVTAGAADAITAAAIANREPPRLSPNAGPLPGGPFDVVIADLLYSQLLYPALIDSGLGGEEIDDCLRRHGQALTDNVVRTLHATAPGGIVIHVHDLLGWWPGHRQPVTAVAIVSLFRADPTAGLELAALGNRPVGSDPLPAVRSLGAQILETSMWIWPFAPGVEYLACATVTRTTNRSEADGTEPGPTSSSSATDPPRYTTGWQPPSSAPSLRQARVRGPARGPSPHAARDTPQP